MFLGRAETCERSGLARLTRAYAPNVVIDGTNTAPAFSWVINNEEKFGHRIK